MKTRFLLFFLLLLPALAFSQATKETKPVKKDSIFVKEEPVTNNSPVAMNACRMKLIVQKIYPPGSEDLANNACDSLPCLVDIELVSTIGKGVMFNVPLVAGNVFSVHFDYTVTATDKIYPGIQPPLPGLKEGDAIIADVETRSLPGGGFRFYIGGYLKEEVKK